MKFYIVAGERSGDLHGGNLVKALRKRNPNLLFRGFGGDYLKDAGLDLVVHYREMAFMGFAEVLANVFTIIKKLKQCKQDIIQYRPDVIILIDYAGFNLKIAEFAKAKGIKVFWYISPKVWAWNQKRALKLKSNIDRMFVILPFEKEFFKKFDWDVDYVGNPVLDAVKAHQINKSFKNQHNLESENIIALLPGSRKQELERIIPLMADVTTRMPDQHFVVAAVRTLSENLYQPLFNKPNVSFVYEETYDLLSVAQAAVVTSGTATLETALWKAPQVVVYKTRAISYHIGKRVITVSYISLVNLIANKPVVKELIQNDATTDNLANELKAIINGNKRQDVLNGYDEVIRILDTGDSASENTARLMLEYMQSSNLQIK
jgi:lipid-A-disaccharide synthase